MPKYLPNSRFTDCWSSAGNVTFYHRDGVCFWKKKSNPVFPGTLPQMEVQSIHLHALQAWRELPSNIQEKWNFLSVGVQSHRPPFRADHHITGHNLFVSAYHGFAQLGEEHVPEPCAYEDFPVFFAEYLGVEADGEGNLVLRMMVVLGDCQEPERYRLMTRIQFTSPGRGRQPGYLRSHIALENCTAAECIVEVPVADYAGKWDLDLPEYQVHMRYLLIDTKTGYRCNFKKISFVLTIPQ